MTRSKQLQTTNTQSAEAREQRVALLPPIALALSVLLLLAGCGDGETEPVPGEGGGGTGGGAVDCTDPDPFDPSACPEAYPEYECVAYVDGDVEASGDGWSWDSAVKTVQEGIDLARCGALNAGVCELWQVWVKQGSYYIHQGCREHSVWLRPNVSVYGGFVGSESSVLERDWESNETILDGRDGPGDPAEAPRVYHVVAGADDTLLDGFTVQYGLADHDLDVLFQSGAGMGALASTVTVENCTFRDNEAVGSGAGIGIGDEGSAIIRNCTFSNNVAGFHGGGILSQGESLVVTDCTFDGNSAARSGGGVAHSGGTVTVTDSVFRNNVAHAGGGASLTGGTATVTGCTFEDNQAVFSEVDEWANAGGMMFGGGVDATVSSCSFVGNSAFNNGGGADFGTGAVVAVIDCQFESNSAGKSAGGLMVWDADVTVDGTTFSQNQAVRVGGAVEVGDGSAEITSCTFQDNTATEAGGGLTVSNSPVVITASSFAGNSATQDGGALLMRGASPVVDVVSSLFYGNAANVGTAISDSLTGQLSLLNCTIAGNTGTAGGAVANVPDLTITNSILWGNTPEEIVGSGTTAISVTYSDVQAGGFVGDGSIDLDPEFVDLAGGDLHLSAASPCIDVANDSVAPATDLDGNARVGLPDMGAYEYQP